MMLSDTTSASESQSHQKCNQSEHASQANPYQPPAPTPILWKSEELLCGLKEVSILHGSEIYRLRVTRNGKLILQK